MEGMHRDTRRAWARTLEGSTLRGRYRLDRLIGSLVESIEGLVEARRPPLFERTTNLLEGLVATADNHQRTDTGELER